MSTTWIALLALVSLCSLLTCAWFAEADRAAKLRTVRAWREVPALRGVDVPTAYRNNIKRKSAS